MTKKVQFLMIFCLMLILTFCFDLYVFAPSPIDLSGVGHRPKPATSTPANNSSLETYRSDKWGFEITYPKSAKFAEAFQNYYHLSSAWRAEAPFGTKGVPVLSISGYQINDNNGVYKSYPLYYDAEVRVGVSHEADDLANCLKPEPGENVKVGTAVINGVVFTTIPIEAVGMSQYLEGVSYRTIQNGVCYAIEQLKTGSSYRDNPSPKDISDKKLNAEYAALKAIVNSFKFTNSAKGASQP